MNEALDPILLMVLVVVVLGCVCINCKLVYGTKSNNVKTQEETFDDSLERFNVDKIFYINLDKRLDRNEQIKNELVKAGVDLDRDVERYPAIYDSKNGHIGCAKSHRNIMDIVIERGYERVLVFEDDFIFTDYEAISKVNTFLNKFGNNWDVLQLSIGYKILIDLDQANYDFDVSNVSRVEFGTAPSGYMVNKSIFKALRDKIDEAVKLMEKEAEEYNDRRFETKYAFDQHWGDLQKVSKWYVFQPVLGDQGGVAGGSTTMDVNGFMDI